MSTNIVFIDSRVTDYQTLIEGLTEPAEVFILEGQSDGLAQMVIRLQGRTGIDAIHIISHGSQGTLYLGSTVLDSDNLATYGSQLTGIGNALTATGDILLYGCNVAQGDVGDRFIRALAQYTGADVAASNDVTGASAINGDWQLEASAGAIDVTAIVSANSNYKFTLGLFTGTNGNDTLEGTVDDDTLLGGAGADSINGSGGNDSIEGGDEPENTSIWSGDALFGGPGNDTILGGAGADRLYGNQGNDSLNGGDGNDNLEELHSEGNDTLIGGAGDDSFQIQTGWTDIPETDLAYGGDGDDSFNVIGSQPG